MPSKNYWRGRFILTVFVRDLVNVLRFGRAAPRWAQRIYVDPRALANAVLMFTPDDSGRVIGGDWDCETIPTEDTPAVGMALERWRSGKSWEETGAFKFLANRIEEHGAERDGCRTWDDIVARYEGLDRMFEQIRSERRVRPAGGRALWPSREHDGILVHVGRDGRLLFGGRGCHRLAAALVAEVPLVPAQLGVVHPDAVSQVNELAEVR